MTARASFSDIALDYFRRISHASTFLISIYSLPSPPTAASFYCNAAFASPAWTLDWLRAHRAPSPPDIWWRHKSSHRAPRTSKQRVPSYRAFKAAIQRPHLSYLAGCFLSGVNYDCCQWYFAHDIVFHLLASSSSNHARLRHELYRDSCMLHECKRLLSSKRY
jgi:hypothetical protein